MGESRNTAGAHTVNLDLRGQVCPATLLLSLREINNRRDDLQRGTARLVILTDHRDATVTVPDTASSMGYEVSVAKVEGHYVITIEGAKEAR